jgi:hypothetical protein
LRKAFDALPVRVKLKVIVGRDHEVPRTAVVRYIFLEENYGVPGIPKGAAESAPNRGVAVPPGRANGKTEDDDPHRSSIQDAELWNLAAERICSGKKRV